MGPRWLRPNYAHANACRRIGRKCSVDVRRGLFGVYEGTSVTPELWVCFHAEYPDC